ncbi:MAG: hypothetical protein O7B99_14690 [Planctomycetota bacterium]|nr:hypothetical protein [Planctomycetota bacterium]
MHSRIPAVLAVLALASCSDELPPDWEGLVGRVEVGEGESAKNFRICLASPGRRPWEPTSKWTVPDRDGSFRIEALPGTYTLDVWPPEEYSAFMSQTSILSIGVLEVLEGRPTYDPLLNPLDLRGKANEVRITVVDEDGKAIPSPRFHLEVGGMRLTKYFVGLAGFRKSHELISPALPFRLWVVADNHRTAELPYVYGDRTVVMQEGLPVRIGISNYPPELSRKKYLEVGMSLRESPWGGSSGGSGDMDENGQALVFVPAPGDYDISFQFKKNVGFDTRFVHAYATWFGEPVHGFRPIVTVKDTTEEQLFRIELPESAIENIVAQAKD